MLQAINTKLLIAILAALAAISTYLVHEHNVSQKAAAEAARTAAILRQQEAERKAEADAHRQQEQAELQKAEQEKRKHSSNNKATHKTWQTYIP